MAILNPELRVICNRGGVFLGTLLQGLMRHRTNHPQKVFSPDTPGMEHCFPLTIKAAHLRTVSLGVFVDFCHGDVCVKLIPVFLHEKRQIGKVLACHKW